MPRRQTLRESSSSMRIEHFSISESEKSVVTSTPVSGGGGFTNLRLKSPEFLSPSIIASPNWIPGNEAVFRTPRSPSPVKTRRRTTMIRTEIMSKERDTPVWRQSIAGDVPHDFKVPSLMFVSPPGVKTRSRRSSMFVSSQPEKTSKAKGKLTAGKGPIAQKQGVGVKRAGRTTRKNVTNITSEKLALSEITIDMTNLVEKGSNVAAKPQAKKANQNKVNTRSKRSAKLESTSLKTEKQDQNNVTFPSRNEISSTVIQTPSRKRKIVSPIRSIDNDEEMNRKTTDVEKVSLVVQQNKSGSNDLVPAKMNESPVRSAVKAQASPSKKKKPTPARKGKASPIRKEKASPIRKEKASPARSAVKSSSGEEQKASPAKSAVKKSSAVKEKASPAKGAVKASLAGSAVKNSSAVEQKASPAKSGVKSSPARSAVKKSPARSAVKNSAIEQKASPARSAVKKSPARSAVKNSAIEQKASPAKSAVKKSPAKSSVKSSPVRSAVKISSAVEVEQTAKSGVKSSPTTSAVKKSAARSAVKKSPARSAVKSSPVRSAVKISSAVEVEQTAKNVVKSSSARSVVNSFLVRDALNNSHASKEKTSLAWNEQTSLDRKVEMAVSGMKENETTKWNEAISSEKTEKLFPSIPLKAASFTSGMSQSRQITMTMNRNALQSSSPSWSMKRASLSAKTDVASPAGKIAREAMIRDVSESESYDFEVTDVEEQQSSTDDLNMTLSHTTHSSRCTIL